MYTIKNISVGRKGWMYKIKNISVGREKKAGHYGKNIFLRLFWTAIKLKGRGLRP